MPVCARFVAVLLLAAATSAAGSEYRYAIRDGGFAIRNGGSWFNRPIFGTNDPSMLLSGDRPAFAYFAPYSYGKVGTLYLAVGTGGRGKWLHHAAQIDFVYQPGLTRHRIEDPSLAGGVLEVTAVGASDREGFSIELRWLRRPSAAMRVYWVFGGASGYDAHWGMLIEKLQLSPADTSGNRVEARDGRMSLTGPAMKGKSLIGGTDITGVLAVKDAFAVPAGPLAVERSTSAAAPVAFFSGDWPAARDSVHLTFAVDRLADSAGAQVFEQAVDHYRRLARRVKVKTPDPYFDLAVEAMVIADDAIWKPPAFVHGALSWMDHYLGWRTWYGADALGWHDRVKTAILAHVAHQVRAGEDRGAIPAVLGQPSVFYNMNEVFLEHVLHHYRWTADRQLLASLLPVIEGVIAWEKRRLDPDGNGLYECCLDTWITDSHWHNGGDSTQASAYMYRAHLLAGEASAAAGRDPKPYRDEADRIRRTINDKLWLRGRGHYGEYIDRIGLKRMHPEPELPALYHPIEFDVADQFQAYQMLRFTETQLRNEKVARGGRLVWSSNWTPNYKGTATHSTNDLVAAEVINLALAYYRSGQFDKAYDLVKGTYAGMYQGGIPGGLSCHIWQDGRQRDGEEFADPISLFAKTAVEGVFGIEPEMQRGIVRITPGFPADWKKASIETPDLGYSFRRDAASVEVTVTLARPAQVHFRVPLHDARLKRATLDGAPVAATVEPGIGESFAAVVAPECRSARLQLTTEPRPPQVRYSAIAVAGDSWQALGNVEDFRDPQGVLESARAETGALRAMVRPGAGWKTVFAKVADRWEPLNVDVRPPLEIVSAKPDFEHAAARIVLRNNRGKPLNAPGRSEWAGRSEPLAMALPAHGEAEVTVRGARLLPGRNHLQIESAGLRAGIDVVYWPPRQVEAEWRPIDLGASFNDSLSKLYSHRYTTSEPRYPVCLWYMLEHLSGGRNQPANDRRLRRLVDDRGLFTTASGIPFRQRREGDNLVALSRWDGFPTKLDVPVGARAGRLYVLLTAVTFPMQSHIANACVRVHYEDGGSEQTDLVNPGNFDNGWALFGGTYHYGTNGMEVIGEVSPKPAPILRPRILSQRPPHEEGFPGKTWENLWGRQPFEDPPIPPHADIVDIACDPGRTIRSLEIEVFSNDIVVGVYGVTTLTRRGYADMMLH